MGGIAPQHVVNGRHYTKPAESTAVIVDYAINRLAHETKATSAGGKPNNRFLHWGRGSRAPLLESRDELDCDWPITSAIFLCYHVWGATKRAAGEAVLGRLSRRGGHAAGAQYGRGARSERTAPMPT